MTTIIQSSTSPEYIGPNSGITLAQDVGCDLSEGVQVALFPCEPSETDLGPKFAYAQGVTGRAVLASIGSWGSRVLDIVLSDGKAVKWWKVREYCRSTKQDVVPVDWQGPIADIPGKYFTPAMGVRFWNSGPWFWPVQGTHLEDNLKVLERFIDG